MNTVTLLNVSFGHPRTVPVGVLSLAAVLERAGRAVAVRDYAVRSYRDLDGDSFIAAIDGAEGVVGVGCMSDTLPFVLTALEGFKARNPGTRLVLGGPGPTGVAGEIIAAFPWIDVVVRGEGEETLLEVVECVERGGPGDLKGVKGICWRRGEEAVMNAPRERIANLDDLPMPLYESIPMDEYSLVNVVSSRGCPYHCTFCDVAPLWDRKHRRRSAANIVDEIRHLKHRYGKSDFEFTDETFVLKREAVLEFCAGLREQELDVRWSCTGRVNLVDEELLAEMAACGCGGLFFGVESGSDTVLARIRKDFTAAEVIEAIHRTNRHMRPVCSFIWGFPFETLQDFGDTLLVMVYLSRLGADTRLNRLAPFPLAPLYREYRSRLVDLVDERAVSPFEPFEIRALPAGVQGLVKRSPDLFPQFYRFPSEELEEKGRMAAALDRHWHTDEGRDPLRREGGGGSVRPCVEREEQA